jgi:hypothetical protein
MLNLFFSLVFRVVDLARDEQAEEAALNAQSSSFSLWDEDSGSSVPLLTLRNGVYEVEINDFEQERGKLYDGGKRVQLVRGASAVFR